MSTWLINGNLPETLGLTVTGGTFNNGRASSVRLAAGVNFDAAEIFGYNSAVTILRDGSPFFQGKVRAIPKSGSGSAEGHDYLVEDVWAELERLTYQEPWAIRQPGFTGTAYSPTVILGMNSAGARINVGEQITEVLEFAADQGLGLTVGAVPAGMTLWPSEVTGMSCAAVIRNCLQYYPDWIPWINHATSPPTFNVTARADVAGISLPVTDLTDFTITKTQDRVPDGVRIVYLTATKIDDDVYRTMRIDQYPAVSEAELAEPAGPGILVTTVELAGMQMQIEKQQVQTRTLPESGSEDIETYLKLKFPVLADIPDDEWSFEDWTLAVLDDAEDAPDPIDEKLTRRLGTSLSHLPRELVRGNVTEWMQKHVGRIKVEFTLLVSGTASDAHRKTLERIPQTFTVVATDAVTKIYKGVSSYTAADDAPTGIAAAYYATLTSGCYFEGSATLHGEELSALAWHGSKLSLSGGAAEWATMGAPVHSVSWDLATCETAVNFGPNPDYSVQDFMEFLKLLNKRPNTEYTLDERTGDRLGDDAKISARGDSIGSFDGPETTTYGGGGGSSTSGAFHDVFTDDDQVYLLKGTVFGGEGSEVVDQDDLKLCDVGDEPADGTELWLKIDGTAPLTDGVLTPAFDVTGVSVETAGGSNVIPTADSTSGTFYHLLGSWMGEVFRPTEAGGNLRLSFCPLAGFDLT